MSENSRTETTQAETADEGKRRATRKSRAKTVAGKKEAFDFVGKVESLIVRGGSDAATFEFGLRGRQGARKVFRLKTSDSFSMGIMAPIVTAAHATEAKIGVRVATVDGDMPYVVEVTSRPKLGKAP